MKEITFCTNSHFFSYQESEGIGEWQTMVCTSLFFLSEGTGKCIAGCFPRNTNLALLTGTEAEREQVFGRILVENRMPTPEWNG